MSPTHVLFDTPPEPAFDRLTALASALLEAPVTLLSLVDDKRQFFKSVNGLGGWAAEARGTPLTHSFCQHVVAANGPLAIEDARLHPLVKDNLAIGDLGVVAYLGVPVHADDGRAIGSFCAIDGQPRRWTDRDREVLEVLAATVDAEVRLRETLVRQAELIGTLSHANTALKAARGEAEAARRLAEEALEDRMRLFAGLGHELRTPLNGIFGGLALLDMAEDTAQRARFTAMIRDSGETLMRFVDNVVAYARASAGHIAPEQTAFDPGGPVDAALRACAAYATSRHLVLAREDGAAPLRPCLSDPGLVEQVVTNLLGNAIKYTEAGRVTVTIAQDRSGTTWRVCDTGPGVPEALREQIFQPFDRGDPSVAARHHGSGLGLAVARLTAESLGGTLRLEPPAPDGGAVFALHLADGPQPPATPDAAAP